MGSRLNMYIPRWWGIYLPPPLLREKSRTDHISGKKIQQSLDLFTICFCTKALYYTFPPPGTKQTDHQPITGDCSAELVLPFIWNTLKLQWRAAAASVCKHWLASGGWPRALTEENINQRLNKAYKFYIFLSSQRLDLSSGRNDPSQLQ